MACCSGPVAHTHSAWSGPDARGTTVALGVGPTSTMLVPVAQGPPAYGRPTSCESIAPMGRRTISRRSCNTTEVRGTSRPGSGTALPGCAHTLGAGRAASSATAASSSTSSHCGDRSLDPSMSIKHIVILPKPSDERQISEHRRSTLYM